MLVHSISSTLCGDLKKNKQKSPRPVNANQIRGSMPRHGGDGAPRENMIGWLNQCYLVLFHYPFARSDSLWITTAG
jgi:hypothetical protein